MRDNLNQDIGWITMAALQPINGDPVYKLLIIDDSAHDRLLYRRLLERSDVPFRIYESSSVAEGLSIARQEKMDCIILDYRLPDGDGIDFIRAWQGDAEEIESAVIMVTGQGSEQAAVDAMKMGALDYIAKSAIIDGYFVQSALNAIERSQLKRQIREYQKNLDKLQADFSEFSHIVSHDLKAPLRRIHQYSKLLEQDGKTTLSDEGQEYIERLSINATRIHRLVDDLFSYAQSMSAQEEKAPSSLKKIVESVMDNLADTIKNTKAIIEVKELPSLPVYPSAMRQMIKNIISNALKYQGNSSPRIEIFAQEHARHYEIGIKDHGIGIETRYHEDIFRPFKRLHSQDVIDGSGLGLATCQKIAAMHGGKMWVESTTDEGACFKFTLPK